MTVSGEQIEQLRNALVDAFPDSPSLEAMVRFVLGENLNAISEEKNLNDRVFKLICRCKTRGCLEKFVRGAKAQNPGNEDLGRVYDAWPFAPAKALEGAPCEGRYRTRVQGARNISRARVDDTRTMRSPPARLPRRPTLRPHGSA